jgi:hypothetical protein
MTEYLNGEQRPDLDLSKLIHADKPAIQTETVKLELQQHPFSWDLIAYNEENGQRGIAAHGPIESLPIIIKMMQYLGANPKRVQNPLFKD